MERTSKSCTRTSSHDSCPLRSRPPSEGHLREQSQRETVRSRDRIGETVREEQDSAENSLSMVLSRVQRVCKRDTRREENLVEFVLHQSARQAA